MGNSYAPYFVAQLYLNGDRKRAADARRALALLELSANRGNEYAYVRLAWGHRDGVFTGGKPDLRRAYFDASLARGFGPIRENRRSRDRRETKRGNSKRNRRRS